MVRSTTERARNRLRGMDQMEARAKIQRLLLTGDNRLKQGVDHAKVRETYEEALRVAREAGVEEGVRPLVEVRLADLERLAGGSPPPDEPVP
jgi:vancomycin permeability regulator SanA